MGRLRALLRGRIRYRITHGGWLFLAALSLVGVGAFMSGNNMLFLIFSAMLALLLVSGFLGRLVLAGLELQLLLPRHVAARAPADARIRLRNLKRLTPSFSIELSGRRQTQTGAEPILREPVYFPIVPGGQAVEIPVKLTFPHRGIHRDNLFVLSTSFPFGFLRREAFIPILRETLVFPALENQAAAERLLARNDGETAIQQRGRGQDFYRIRPWEASDGVRLVDWKSTAHTGELQAREFARDDHTTVEILFDCTIPAGGEQRFEMLVEECACLIWNLSEAGRPFELSSGPTLETEAFAALTWLATVQPAIAEAPTDLPDAEAPVILSLWT